jgi:hypothetical protein
MGRAARLYAAEYSSFVLHEAYSSGRDVAWWLMYPPDLSWKEGDGSVRHEEALYISGVSDA